MVQGINWNNYSPEQIINLRNNGVQVPDDVYKKAEDSLPKADADEVTNTSDDAKDVKYTVVDETQGEKTSDYESKIQDAADLKKQLEDEGASLKSMVKQFTSKTNEATEVMNISLEEISQFSDLILEKQDIATESKAKAEEEQAGVQQAVDEMNQEIEKKEDELEVVNDKIESGEATEDDEAKAEELQGDIHDIAQNANAEIKGKEAVVTDLNSNTEHAMSALETLDKLTNTSYNEAKKGIDLAKETNDLSAKLYKKGQKAGKLGTALGAIVGGVGGYVGGKFAGNAIAEKGINNKNIDGFAGTALAAKNTHASEKVMGAQALGALGGAAGLGALGSLFGRENRKLGKAGMEAASQLNTVATNQMNMAQTIANNNGIAINITTDATSAVTTLDDAVKSAESDASDKANVKDDTKAPETTTDTSNGAEDDDKKKKEV